MLKFSFLFFILAFNIQALAQDKTAEMFRASNPNLMNLNESKEYTGAPLIYIQGIKVPEKATNDLEELQIKMFGTKNVRQVTKDTLTFDDTPIDVPPVQEENFSFETPFSRPVQSGFIRHISDFIVMVQLMNKQQISVTEQQVLISTDSETYWTRQIPLPTDAIGQIIEFSQNDQAILVPQTDQKNMLTLSSPIPLNSGVNRLTLKYDIQLPAKRGKNQTLSLDLTGSELDWDINRMSILLLTPIQLNFTQNQLMFGTNRVAIPDIYTQQTDAVGNTVYKIHRIVPASANIYLETTFDGAPLDSLPPEKDYTLWLLIIGTLGVMLIYWVLNYWWEKRNQYKFNLNKIKPIKNPAVVAHQMDAPMTTEKWQRLITFARDNHLKNRWEHQQNQSDFAIKVCDFIKIAGEITFGSVLILIGFIFATSVIAISLHPLILLGCSVFTICGIIILYIVLRQKIVQKRWQFLVQQLKSEKLMFGMTTQQVQRLYPILVVAGEDRTWTKQMMSVNPNVAKNTYLTQGG